MPDSTSLSKLRVLIAWPPDSNNLEALEVAAWLERTTPTLLRCVATTVRPWPAPPMSKKWHKQQTKNYIEAVKASFSTLGVPASSLDKKTAVVAEADSESIALTQAAKEFEADLVIVGSKAAAPKRRFLAGSTADSLLHSSPQPLLLAPRTPKLAKRGITRISFALMGGDSDSAALHHAATLAAEWAIPVRIIALSPDGFDTPDDLTHRWRENALAELDRFSDEVHSAFPNVAVSTEIGSGSGWQAALKALKWKKGDLMCFGSVPLGAFERVFIGSQTSQILPFIKVPVLMIPAAQP